MIRLEDMGHRLNKIWRAFKTEFVDSSLNLGRHTTTVSGLNKFEDLRYPGTRRSAISISADWYGPSGTITTGGRLRTPKKYVLIVTNIDELFADTFRAVPWNPEFFFASANGAALDAIRRENRQSVFLTKLPLLP